jgi:hypothetical protein
MSRNSSIYCDQHTLRNELCSRCATWIAPATHKGDRAAGIEEHYCTYHAHQQGIHHRRGARLIEQPR